MIYSEKRKNIVVFFFSKNMSNRNFAELIYIIT